MQKPLKQVENVSFQSFFGDMAQDARTGRKAGGDAGAILARGRDCNLRRDTIRYREPGLFQVHRQTAGPAGALVAFSNFAGGGRGGREYGLRGGIDEKTVRRSGGVQYRDGDTSHSRPGDAAGGRADELQQNRNKLRLEGVCFYNLFDDWFHLG